MIDLKKQRIVRVIGHKNPDTDSICSAIAYAYLKNQISDAPHEPRRAGHINKETKFVLKYFGVRKPRMSVDAAPAIGNIDIREEPGIGGEMSLRDAWQQMVERDIDTLCIPDELPQPHRGPEGQAPHRRPRRGHHKRQARRRHEPRGHGRLHRPGRHHHGDEPL